MTHRRRRAALAVVALLGTGLGGTVPVAADAGPGEVPSVGSPRTAQSQRAATSITLGQTSNSGLGLCTGTAPFAVAVGASGGGASYVVPSAGVLTSWSTIGSASGGAHRLLVFLDGPADGHKTLVAKGPFEPITGGVGLKTFPARVPVQAGQELGMGTSVTGLPCALVSGIAGDVLGGDQGFNADTDTDMTENPTPGFRPNVSAVLESDADGDGYGDVTQDLCPESKLSQVACPAPDTTVTKAPKAKSPRRKAGIKFTSNVPGSTFTCVVDAKPARPCTSPFRKRFKYGRHTVVVTATSPAGIVEQAPATVTFKVKRPS